MLLLRSWALTTLLMMAFPAEAAWLVAETPHFRIYGSVSESRIREEAETLEDYHKLLELLTKRKFAENAPKLDIYLVDQPQDMQIVAPGLGRNVSGIYTASSGGILAMSVEPKGNDSEWMNSRDVLLHEYAHHYMMQAGNTAVPAWYVEGFAEYLMTADFRSDRIDFGGFNKARLWALQNMPWLPLEQILLRPKGVDQDMFYAQSWLLTHYLNRAEGMPAKRDAYLKRVAEGGDPIEAFKTEISPDLKAFSGRLRNYISGRGFTFSRMARTAKQSAPVRVTALSPAAESMLLPLVAVQLPQTAENDEANLKRLRAAAARYPDDPWAKRAMAIAQAAAGSGDPKAAALLDAELALRPDDAELLRWRARLHEANKRDASAEDISAARRLLVRAFKVDPSNWLVLRDYVETFLARDGTLPKPVLDVLISAHNLAPQESHLAFLTGWELAQAGHYEAAAVAISPVVNNPHMAEDMTLQRGLLEALRSGDKEKVEAALLSLRVAR